MKCSSCGTENNSDAKFCRKCGAALVKELAIVDGMDRFPGYNFEPTNLIDWKKPVASIFIKSISLLGAIAAFILILYSVFSFFVYDYETRSYESEDTPLHYVSYVESPVIDLYCRSSYCYDRYIDNKDESLQIALKRYRSKVASFIPFFLVTLVFMLIVFYMINGGSRKSNIPKLHSLADYIEHYKLSGLYGRKRRIFKFFLKDGKFGVMDVLNCKVQINAEYDKLSWKIKNKYINAEKEGRKYTIDINGQELK